MYANPPIYREMFENCQPIVPERGEQRHQHDSESVCLWGGDGVRA